MRLGKTMSGLAVLGLLCSAAAQPAGAPLQAAVLKDWMALKETMHKLAAEMPAEKFGYRPTPGQQTFGERVVHVAAVNVGILQSLGAEGIAKPEIDRKATEKEAAIKAMDESFDYGAAILKQQSDQALLQVAPAGPKFLGPSTRLRLTEFLAGHTWDIYGQLVVYLRLNGHVPPASQRM